MPSKKKAAPLPPPPALAAATAAGRLPWTLAHTARLGRHAVAARAITPGEVILSEAAVAAVPRARHAGDACRACTAPLGPTRVVGGPGSAPGAPPPSYCSPACAAAHEPIALAAAPGRAAVRGLAAAHGHAHAHGGGCCSGDTAGKLGVEDLGDLLALVVELDAVCRVEAAAAAAGRRAGGEEAGVAAPPPSSFTPQDPAPAAASPPGVAAAHILACGSADVAVLAHAWDRQPPGWRAQVSAATAGLADALRGAPHAPTAAGLAALASRAVANAHGTGAGNPANVDFGFGLFPATAMLNHSCSPNAAFVAGDSSSGSRDGGGAANHANQALMTVRAVTPIRAGDQITVAYINLYAPKGERAAELAASKHFACGCARCGAPAATGRDRHLQAVACRATKGCGGWVLPAAEGDKKGGGEEAPHEQHAHGDACGGGGGCGGHGPRPQPWACEACGRPAPADGSPADPALQTSRAYHTLGRAFAALHGGGGPGRHATARPLFEAVLALAPKTLHPHHAAVFDALMPAANCARAAGDGEAAARRVGDLLAAMDALVGVPTAEVGNLAHLHAELLAERAAGGAGQCGGGAAAAGLRRTAAAAAARRAVGVRALVLGDDHPGTRASAALLATLGGK